ncbi:hypothetical protein GRF61_11285 [Azoarcus sp. TTM-91]|uniref:hypothetical protein n=1 Tax=Azoarcus sp. TTM-91 TaxID=2691581 RepID=UPI00145F6588|nr:hypothetical protein [Azoarcus sp. TTM-91]NMG35024.1 hypothetical protein [Azoarcus sp. TTM-91]
MNETVQGIAPATSDEPPSIARRHTAWLLLLENSGIDFRIDIHRLDPDRLHALQKEHKREFAACDLVGEVGFTFFNAERSQPDSKSLVSDAGASKLRSEYTASLNFPSKH